MSWKKYFNPVKTTSNTDGVYSPMGNGMRTGKAGPARTNYSSYLPDIYVGSPNRVERYGQYNTMDLDSEVNAALDILAEFCTQKNKGNRTTFYVDFLKKATQSEVTVIHQYLQQWFKLQKFETRIFRILRNIFKYGDAFFLRDPETKKWFHIDPAKVVRIIVNESEGKTPEQYVIKDVNINFKELVATSPLQTTGNVTGGGGGYYQGGVRGMVGTPQGANALGSRFQLDQDEVSVDSRHVVHISLSEGLDNNFPFGNSLLETIFKVYKQKELLEDAIIIYRVQRAPERRVFYVDVGNMPSHLAMQFVERVKTEIHQRRIPSQQGGSNSLIDSSYNPLCLDLDTKIPLLDGRTLKLSELITEFENGKENWAYSCNPETGEIVPGVINWAGITRENAEVIKLTFDNGEHLICTPDHKIPVFGKGFVEAKDILETDSLISFNRRNNKISDKSNDYEQIWDHSKKDWVWTHRAVGEFFRNKNKHQEFTYLNEYRNAEKSVIHHKDYDRFNNDPKNLQYMNKKDHILYHSEQVANFTSLKYKNTNCNVKFVCSVFEKLKKLVTKLLNKHFVKEVNQFNHKVVKVERVSNRTTGTITIDGTERWHNFHTFAIESGIFIKNSINEDFFFPQTSEGRGSKVDTLPGGCFAMDTKVSLLDGRELSIREIETELNTEKELWCYSCEPKTGKIVPGLISWAGVTQKSAKVMKITLDNGEEIVCTPDHKFPQYNADFKPACDFKVGDSFITLNKIIHPLTLFKMIFDNKNKKWFNARHLFNDRHDNIIDFILNKIGNILNRFLIRKLPLDHRIVNIEYLNDPIEVGTLTIDQDETYHNYHTFALSCGVMTKNSNLGEIDDLRFFTNKMVRGLRIPSSYLPTGAEDSAAQYNDGRVGTAYIQELRFNTYCERLQSLVTEEFDQDFKRYLLEKGLNVDTSMFNLRFQPPQNFAAYRQTELDNSRISTFTTMMGVPFISNRYAMKRYLGMSDEEIAENERMWREENDDTYGSDDADAAAQMRPAGITDAGIESDLGGLGAELPDMGSMETPPLEGEGPESATEQPIGPGGGTAPPTGAAPA